MHCRWNPCNTCRLLLKTRDDEYNFLRRFVEKYFYDKLDIIYTILGIRLFCICISQCASGNEFNWIRGYFRILYRYMHLSPTCCAGKSFCQTLFIRMSVPAIILNILFYYSSRNSVFCGCCAILSIPSVLWTRHIIYMFTPWWRRLIIYNHIAQYSEVCDK